ncbi:MAG: hypothetical protein GIW98_05480 [Candidatus Eremiobacteraeota bacterium]|nr:hypothetical protein [Candidatus Eremiobacteraeota bacterium]
MGTVFGCGSVRGIFTDLRLGDMGLGPGEMLEGNGGCAKGRMPFMAEEPQAVDPPAFGALLRELGAPQTTCR